MRNGLVVLAVLVGATSCSNEPARDCTLLSCTSGVTVSTTTTLSHDDLLAAVITACRNEGCSSGKATDIPTGPDDHLAVTLQGPVATTVSMTAPASGTYAITVNFAIDDQTAKDGDYYEVRLDKDGAAKASGTVKYTEFSPNGADCPPACHTATIKK